MNPYMKQREAIISKLKAEIKNTLIQFKGRDLDEGLKKEIREALDPVISQYIFYNPANIEIGQGKNGELILKY